MPEVDVKTKLTLDDQASNELNKIKQGFKDTAEAEKSAVAGAVDFAKQVASVALGNYLPKLIGGIKEAATGWFTAANNAYNNQQAVAGMITVMQDVPWADARKQAEGLHREMRQMAIDIGQDFDDVNMALDTMVTTMGAGKDDIDEISNRMQQLTVVANVSGKQVSALAGEYAMAVEQGMVRTRGTLARMLGAVGTFGDDMKKGVTEFMKMDPGQRMEIISAGLDKIASKMGRAEPTFSDLTTSLGNTIDMLEESFGTPVLKALIPVVKDLVGDLGDLRPEIERFATMLAQDFAEGARNAAKWIKDGIVYVKDHWQEIATDARETWDELKSAWQFARDTVKWIVDHKEELALAWGASKATSMVGAGNIMKLGGAIAGAGGAAAAASGGTAAAGGAAAAGAGAAAAALGLAALTAAIAGLGLAAWQGSKLWSELWGDASEEAMNAQATMEQANEAFRRNDLESALKYAEMAAAQGEVGRKVSAEMIAAITQRQAMEKQLQDELAQAVAETNLTDAIDVYNRAVEMGNDTMRQMAVDAIAASTELTTALDDTKVTVIGGFGALKDAVIQSADDLEAALRQSYQAIARVGSSIEEFKGLPFTEWGKEAESASKEKKKVRSGAGRGGGGINVNKMEIHQEFRDQDPDRIAVVFRRDIVNAAVKRVQSRRASIFGI